MIDSTSRPRSTCGKRAQLWRRSSLDDSRRPLACDSSLRPSPGRSCLPPTGPRPDSLTVRGPGLWRRDRGDVGAGRSLDARRRGRCRPQVNRRRQGELRGRLVESLLEERHLLLPVTELCRTGLAGRVDRTARLPPPLSSSEKLVRDPGSPRSLRELRAQQDHDGGQLLTVIPHKYLRSLLLG